MSVRNHIEITGSTLVVVPKLLDRILGFKSRVAVELDDIVTCEVREKGAQFGMAPRVGTDLGFKRSGMFWLNSKKHYVNTCGKNPVLYIGLKPEAELAGLILHVDNPQALAETISRRITGALLVP